MAVSVCTSGRNLSAFNRNNSIGSDDTDDSFLQQQQQQQQKYYDVLNTPKEVLAYIALLKFKKAKSVESAHILDVLSRGTTLIMLNFYMCLYTATTSTFFTRLN